MADGLFSGVLPYIYSRADALKRSLNDVVSNPMASTEQNINYLNENARDFNERTRQLNAQAFANPQRPLQVTNPQALSSLTEQTMNGAMGFAPAGMVVGKTAQGMQSLVAQADMLEKQGYPEYKITEITGLEKIPMGQGRFPEWGKQISDVGATINQKAIESLKTPLEKNIDYKNKIPVQNVTVGDLLNHPELFNAYPEIKNIPVEKVNGFLSMGGTQAYFDPTEKTIGLARLNQFMMDKVDQQLSERTSNLLHELQHYVQNVEQWPRGGSSSEFSKKSTQKIQKQLTEIDRTFVEKTKDLTNEKYVSPYDLKAINDYRNGESKWISDNQKKLLATEGIDDILNQFSKFDGLKNRIKYREEDVYKKYKSLAGEAQARATQKQFETGKMTVPLTQSYDVPVESLIYRDPFGTPLR